jgi:hypothetical protein
MIIYRELVGNGEKASIHSVTGSVVREERQSVDNAYNIMDQEDDSLWLSCTL